MAKCPKCQRKLHFYNISQYCPSCGVNIRLYNFEENFIREAKLSELSRARLKAMLGNIKYSFMGSGLVKARLIVMFLPLLSLLIPTGYFSVEFPFVSVRGDFGILGIVNIVTGGSLNYIFSMCSSELEGMYYSKLRVVLICLVAVILLALLSFTFSLLGFLSIRHMQKLAAAVSAFGVVSSLITLVKIFIFASSVSESFTLSAGVGYGLLVTIFMFSAVFSVNILLCRKGIHPQYEEGVLERIEIYKKVKSGELNIDDLPQPVVETAMTRAIEKAIEEEEAAFAERFSENNSEVDNL